MRKSKFNTWQAAAISKDVEADMGQGACRCDISAATPYARRFKGWTKRDYFNLYMAIWLVLLTLEVFSLHMQLRSMPH